MTRRFELFVASRYLTAPRKQAVLSVITVISVLGVAAGVMALIISLAVLNGFSKTLQESLLGATAHVSILEREPGFGIGNWREFRDQIVNLPHVESVTPTLYGYVLLSGPLHSQGAVLKGVEPGAPIEALQELQEGFVDRLHDAEEYPPGIILGADLSRQTGMIMDSVVTVISPQGELTPFGPRPSYHQFRVVGVFESGFYDLDATWTFASMDQVQRVLALDDVVNSIEIRLDDINQAPKVAAEAEAILPGELAATTWMEQQRLLLNAFRMERMVAVIVIGLIELVAGLNILITLIMMVMEKNRDIAILMSMGTRKEQVRNIFMLQGVIIGVIGSVIGLAAGYGFSLLADHYRWFRIDAEVYALSYVPFDPRWVDALWVPAAALLVSFLATIYPARAATRVDPAEALRYE